MVSERKLGHAVGVRACDNCVKKRARWYCGADDAFLCDSCDSSVHSANPLARRHERVRLKISSSKEKELVTTATTTTSFSFDDEARVDVPSWQKGFTRKARTPRQKKTNFPTHLVPEQEACCSDDENENENENEEQLLYRVPVFDVEKNKYGENGNFIQEMNDFLPSELDLAEFAADVESLLGKGLEDEAFDMEGLGIFDIDHRDDFCLRNNTTSIKDEEYDDENLVQFGHDLGTETFELNFDAVSPIMCGKEEEEEEENNAQIQENKALLKLDYDRVMSAWDYRKSPWITGQRPEFRSGDWWPDYCSGRSGIMHGYTGEVALMRSGTVAGGGGGGREARVSRYREKRRTRLFSKKIRYEVRKLNAEKRPRMKGRFVKRSSFAPTAAAFPPLFNH